MHETPSLECGQKGGFRHLVNQREGQPESGETSCGQEDGEEEEFVREKFLPDKEWRIMSEVIKEKNSAQDVKSVSLFATDGKKTVSSL